MTRQYNHQLKLDRALQHLQSLESKVHLWKQGDTHRYVPEFDRKSGKKRIKVEILDTPPVEFGIIIGDCLHNLRSALDNLVYELIIARHGDPPPSRFVEHSEFPIFGSKVMNSSACRKRIGGIAPTTQTIIEELQPYKRGKKYASDSLWLLHKLSNMDKHRLPALTLLASSGGSYFPASSLLPSDLVLNMGPLEDGTEIASYTPPAGEPETEVNMHFNFIFGIAFGQRSEAPGQDAVLTLKLIYRRMVRKVLPPLVPYLARFRVGHLIHPFPVYCL